MDLDWLELAGLQSQMAAELGSDSDRGLALLGTSAIEVVLEDLLGAFFCAAADRKVLFQGNGPLTTLHARIDMCFALGLVATDERADLHIIRKNTE